MVNYKEINWKLYQGALIPDVPPHIEIDLSESEAKELLKATNAYFVRWTDEWDRGGGEFWYVIKDEREDISQYSSNTRSKIRRGLKRCKVQLVSKEYIADYGYEVYINAFRRYNTFLSPINETLFKTNILNSKNNIEFWGIFVENKLVGYSQNLIEGDSVNYSVIKFHPNFLKYYISYVLFF